MKLICVTVVLLVGLMTVEALARVPIVTGANGYVGKEVVKALLAESKGVPVYCLVRSHRIESEKKYWESSNVRVLPYDMNDGGTSLNNAIQEAKDGNTEKSICVYHIASVFGPTEDPVATAHENVRGTEDVVKVLAKAGNCRLVLTSSMAAVRGTGQEPLNGKFYTNKDWNTLSKLNADNWGACYQWSKAESERRAWKLAKSSGLEMVSICPSFVFGPGTISNSFSIKLVNQWIHGESPVQSRLCVDVRDVAKAHLEAGKQSDAVGKRFLVTTESRVSSKDTADILKGVCKDLELGNPEKIHFDSKFQGGSIPIGEKEVESVQMLDTVLGVMLRPIEQTIGDMARSLLTED